MRKLALLGALCLIACEGDRKPERGVDTSPLADEPMGTIAGTLTYPSDYIPDDIDVCAETLDGKTQHCGAEKSSASYTLKVPTGVYRVFAYLKSDPGDRAYYSQFVRCGYNLNCSSHEPITVTIGDGQVVDGIEPGDWYPTAANGASTSPTDQDSAEDYSESYDGSDDEEPAQPTEESRIEPVRAQPRGALVALFSVDDYPQSALRNDEQGITAVRLSIGLDGRVAGCTVTSSSGSSALDNATCSILTRRARFIPARDETGSPIGDTFDQRIRWEL